MLEIAVGVVIEVVVQCRYGIMNCWTLAKCLEVESSGVGGRCMSSNRGVLRPRETEEGKIGRWL